MSIPWVEKYRPQDLDSIIIQPSLKKIIAALLEKGSESLPNMLFEGSPGTGKTTLAKVIAKELKATFLYINASEENGIDVIRNKMKTFCSSMAMDGLKIVICDEADGLSAQAQDSLRNLIESVHVSTRFIFTCNHPEKISAALKSRLKQIYFEAVDEKPIMKRIGEILKSEGVVVPKDQFPKIAQLLKKNYPDIRKIINHLQYYSSTGTLEIDFQELSETDVFDKYMELVIGKKLSEIREILRNNKLDYEGMIKKVFQKVLDGELKLGENQRAEAIILCAEYVHRSLNFVVDKEINFADFSVQLMMIFGKEK